MIDEFYLIFKDGRITDYYAAKGQEVLHNLIEPDEGSHFLSEIALVSNKSPLAHADTLFTIACLLKIRPVLLESEMHRPLIFKMALANLKKS